ncbi:MAG TPA: transcriptional repressor [Candidatus Edwardsbacteria bacterium]|nr:transcriptional repressor [Candidatus Edwardsbacteria bacterium]
MITNKPTRRASAQRELIWRIVSEGRDHPTAQTIYQRLRREHPGTSLGNVYRNLAILVEEGRLACRKFRDWPERYDAIVPEHGHFVCDLCGAVNDFDLPLSPGIAAASRRAQRTVTGYTVIMHGLCARCKRTSDRSTNRGKGAS